jgi:hypothetical protein
VDLHLFSSFFSFSLSLAQRRRSSVKEIPVAEKPAPVEIPADPIALLGMIEMQNQPDFEDYSPSVPVNNVLKIISDKVNTPAITTTHKNRTLLTLQFMLRQRSLQGCFLGPLITWDSTRARSGKRAIILRHERRVINHS